MQLWIKCKRFVRSFSFAFLQQVCLSKLLSEMQTSLLFSGVALSNNRGNLILLVIMFKNTQFDIKLDFETNTMFYRRIVKRKWNVDINTHSKLLQLKVYQQQATFTKCSFIIYCHNPKSMIASHSQSYIEIFVFENSLHNTKKKSIWFTWVSSSRQVRFPSLMLQGLESDLFWRLSPLFAVFSHILSGQSCFLIIVFFFCHIILWTKPVCIWLYPSKKKGRAHLAFLPSFLLY